MTHPLDGARKRIERANKHLNEIVSLLETDATEYQNSFIVEHDHVRNQPNVLIPPPREIPWEIPFAASDCIHNLRVALDYLMFELSRKLSGDPNPTATQFPLCETLDQFDNHLRAAAKGKGPLRYLPATYINRIEAYQPYKGVDWAETMRFLSNQDKHRELMIIRVSRATMISDGCGEVFKGVGPDRSDVQMERKTTTQITFADQQPVVEALDVMKRQVSLVIDSFSGEFQASFRT